MFILLFHCSLLLKALNQLRPGDALCLKEIGNIFGEINMQGIWKYVSIQCMLQNFSHQHSQLLGQKYLSYASEETMTEQAILHLSRISDILLFKQ